MPPILSVPTDSDGHQVSNLAQQCEIYTDTGLPSATPPAGNHKEARWHLGWTLKLVPPTARKNQNQLLQVAGQSCNACISEEWSAHLLHHRRDQSAQLHRLHYCTSEGFLLVPIE